MNKKLFTVRKMALCAVMVALYVGLAMLAIPLGPLKLTVEALPVIICALLIGPVEAAVVGLLGELLNQMMTYGFTPTTVLWVLPAVVRGLFVGGCVRLMNKRLSVEELAKSKRAVLLVVVCVLSGIIVSCLNTVTLYVDSKMFGYYSYAMVFGALVTRLITGMIASAGMGIVAQPIVLALRKAKIF